MSSDPMTVAATLALTERNLLLRAIGWGTLVAGTLDIMSAIVMYLPRGVGAERVLQSVASGLLGRAAYQSGANAAVLGLLLHFLIMLVIVLVYVLASRRFSGLVNHAAVWGPIYGVIVYGVMNFIVVPLSAIGGGKSPALLDALVQLGIHIVCVGLPIAFIARRFVR